MKRTLNPARVTCLLALCLLAVVPQAALACEGYLCLPVSYDPWCEACVYVGGGGSGGCGSYMPCTCYDVQCSVTPSEEEVAASSLGFVPEELQLAGVCTAAPASTL